MVEDFVRHKGYLTLGTRLKRIGDMLQADVQQLLDSESVAIQTGQYPLIAALDEFGPLTVGELAEALGVSQPGITRSVGQLVKQGVVTVERGEKDQRTKVVNLAPAGQAMVDRGKRDLWQVIDRSLADICGEDTTPLLDELDRLETALAYKSLYRRMRETAPRKETVND